jgi:glycerol-3-phosphate acyltransferase PlsY
VSAVFAPFFALILFNPHHPLFLGVGVIAALLIWRHRGNIRNLLAGTETRIGSGAGEAGRGD